MQGFHRKMVKVMKSFAISKRCHVCAETIASLAYFGRKIFEALLLLVPPPPVDNIFGKHFYYLVKILGPDDTPPPPPPPPPNVDVITTRRPWSTTFCNYNYTIIYLTCIKICAVLEFAEHWLHK